MHTGNNTKTGILNISFMKKFFKLSSEQENDNMEIHKGKKYVRFS